MNSKTSYCIGNSPNLTQVQRDPTDKIQYSRDFLLSRKCEFNNGEILAHIKINQFKSSPFTQAGFKKILWARKQFKIGHLKGNYNNSRPITQSESELNPESPSFVPCLQLVDSNQKHPSTVQQTMNTTLTAEKENHVPNSYDLRHLEAQYEMKFKKLQEENNKLIKELKSRHYKELQDLKLQGKRSFEKTLGVANTVISVDSEEKKSIEKKLRNLLNASESKNKALEEENKILKQQLGDKENEIAAFKLQAEEDKHKITADAQQTLEATRVALTDEANKAKTDFLQVFEAELECAICSEMFVEASLLTTCAHVFCRHCITTWARTRNNNCPVCRTPHTEQHVKRFPLAENILAKIEDKLPPDVLARRHAALNDRR